MEDIAFHWLYDVMDQCNGNSFLLLLLMNHTEDPQPHLQIQVDNTIKKIKKKKKHKKFQCTTGEFTEKTLALTG